LNATGNGRASVAEIAEALRVLAEPGQVLELRMPKTQRAGTVSGYFDDPDRAAAEAARWSGRAAGVYVTLNPVDDALLARAFNRLAERASSTTSDTDVKRRRWLLIDLDPNRPANISATDAEHELAMTRAGACRDYLTGEGWPAPVEADSGNGAHLLYRIDLPNDDPAKQLLERALEALDFQFSDKQVGVDRKVFNASRISKLYGTKACKGDDAPGRPHRYSQLLAVPESLGVVSLEQLEALAARVPQKEADEDKGAKKAGQGGIDPAKWLEDHKIAVAFDGPWGDGGQKWVLRDCPFNEAHTNRSAYVVRHKGGAISAGCQHNGCKGKGWHDLRDLFEPGWRDRASTGQDRSRDAAGQKAAEPLPWSEPLPFDRPAEPPPFPAQLLPAWLAEWVTHEAEATQTPPDLAGCLVLALAGAGVARKVRVRVRDSWTEPANIFGVGILPAGDRKSAVCGDAMSPVLEHEAAERKRMRPIIAAKASAHKVMEVRLKKLEEKAAKEENQAEAHRYRDLAAQAAKELAEHVVPDMPQCYCDDVTPEKLTQLIVRQGGRMLLAGAEGTVFEVCKGRYSESANFDVFLKGHAGDPLRTGRVGRDSEEVERPALFCALAVQPDVVAGLAEQASMRRRGFLARWLYSLPASKVGNRTTAPPAVPDAVAQGYRQGMLWLWELRASEMPGEEAGRVLNLSPEADEALREFEVWLEPQLAEGELLSYLAGWPSKLAGAVARLSLILHMAATLGTGDPWADTISRDTVEAAIKLGRDYFLPHAQLAFGLMGADVPAKDTARVVAWLPANRDKVKVWNGVSVVSRRDIHVGVFGGSRTVEEVAAVCRSLVEHGYLRDAGPAWRHDRQVFEVNPFALLGAHKAA
jgi:hypothetical protein